MENEGIINKRVKDFSKGIDIMQTILIFLIALLVPTFLGGILSKIFGSTSVISTNSQLIVGTIVNAALVVSAINLKGWAKILGVATILSGYVFGTASVYMVYMIPAIWIGNFALIYSYKFLMLGKNKHYFLAGIVGIIVKVAIIFALFNLINLFGVFPEKLVENLRNAMGMTQLITATLGVIAAFVIYKLEKK